MKTPIARKKFKIRIYIRRGPGGTARVYKFLCPLCKFEEWENFDMVEFSRLVMDHFITFHKADEDMLKIAFEEI